MADQNIASNEWTQVRRTYGVARFAPVVTIRRSGDLAISADFVRMAGIAEHTRASIFLSSDGLRLALAFHSNEADDDAFALSRDGGAGRVKGGLNRIITAKSLLAQSPAVAALTRESPAARRYEPKKGIDGRWVIHLAPCFETVLEATSSIDPSATGIYRYRLGDETLYIGRGRLRERLASPERRGWQYDRVEYSVLNDDAAERRWEAHWLSEYRNRHSRWPVHNQIGGAPVAIESATG